MTIRRSSRREFLRATSGATAAAFAAPYFFTGAKGIAQDAKSASKNDRPIVGCIGTGDRWYGRGNGVGALAAKYGDLAAVCDVDREHAANGQKLVKDKQGREVEAFEDYRQILDRKDIDAVTIVTPDHWHSKIAIEALQAGKDVYCEKPLTLTIEEGKQISKVLKQTGRVFQVGTQQRSEFALRFLKAVALVKDGRLGQIKKVQCAIGPVEPSGPIPKGRFPKPTSRPR
jgi:predicted dehydrogenase